MHSVDGLENTTSLTFELDKPYTVQRDDAEEITVCSMGNGLTPHSQENNNVLLYRTEVPIKVDILDLLLEEKCKHTYHKCHSFKLC